MVDGPDDPTLDARPPDLDDLVGLCRELNSRDARYVVVGGMAVIRAGFVRATEDIDLLVDGAPDNVDRVRDALTTLPDGAASELDLGDPARYTVVRVADEIVVDLMVRACGVGYEEAIRDVEVETVDGVPIPFVSPATLLRTKQTVREKDRLDRRFLESLLAGRGPGGG